MLHEPVMTREVLAFLRPEKGGIFVDCTVGMGGHALALLEAGASKVIGLDRDPAAPKSDIYQWLWIEDGAVQALRFVAMARDQVERRIFREAQLQFDNDRGELCWTGSEPIALTPLSSRNLPAPLTQLVNLHLT